ncbi:MAG: rod shape-determining protein MreD, partial [Acidimicrobiales bacterium]|nr:rod shape-determining protein MreD [Acidimicrobiales bacterium]
MIEDRRVRLALVLLSTLALQKGLSSHLYVFGVAPNVLLLMTIAAGLSSTPDRGAIVGFFAGLSFDFITQGPLGLGSLSYCLVGFAAGR